MKLLTKAIETKLIKNNEQRYDDGFDPKPAVKFFNPVGSGTWLISEYDPESRVFFGLCDLGMGYAELGDVGRDELESIKGFMGLGIERDTHWTADKTLSEYASIAQAMPYGEQHIVC